MAARLLPRAALPALGHRCTRMCQTRCLSYCPAASQWNSSGRCFSSSSPRRRETRTPRPKGEPKEQSKELKEPKRDILGKKPEKLVERNEPPPPGAKIRIRTGVRDNMAEWTQELGLFYNNGFHASMVGTLPAGSTLPVIDPTLVLRSMSCNPSLADSTSQTLGTSWRTKGHCPRLTSVNRGYRENHQWSSRCPPWSLERLHGHPKSRTPKQVGRSHCSTCSHHRHYRDLRQRQDLYKYV